MQARRVLITNNRRLQPRVVLILWRCLTDRQIPYRVHNVYHLRTSPTHSQMVHTLDMKQSMIFKTMMIMIGYIDWC